MLQIHSSPTAWVGPGVDPKFLRVRRKKEFQIPLQRKKERAGAALERERKPNCFLEKAKGTNCQAWKEMEGKVGPSGTPEVIQKVIREPQITAGELWGLG